MTRVGGIHVARRQHVYGRLRVRHFESPNIGAGAARKDDGGAIGDDRAMRTQRDIAVARAAAAVDEVQATAKRQSRIAATAEIDIAIDDATRRAASAEQGGTVG